MRALCGAIITAAALIGLGLTALGIGTRYQWAEGYKEATLRAAKPDADAKDEAKAAEHPTAIASRVKFFDMDRPLIFTIVFLTCMAIVGLGIAFLGLAYHHARREREHQLEKERAAAHHRTAV